MTKHKLRCLALALIALLSTASALADFTGPAPLAWRWAYSTAVAPSGAPLIVGDTVYVSVGQRVFALDKATGNQKWRFPLLEPINGNFRVNPIQVDDTLVAHADNRTVFGINQADGELKWTWSAEHAIVGSPVKAGGFLVYNLNGEYLLALDPKTGQPVWEAPVRIQDRIMGEIAAYDTNIYYFSAGRALYSMSVIGKQPTRLAQFSQVSPDVKPLIVNDLMYITSGPYVVCMNAVNGGARWQTNTGHDLVMGPAVSGDSVAVVSRDGKVLFLNLNGQLRMSTAPTGADVRSSALAFDMKAGPSASPGAVGSLFMVPATNGTLNLIDPTNGELKWSYVIRPVTKLAGTEDQPAPVAIPAVGPPTLDGDTLFVLAADGSLLAFDKSIGVDLTGPTIEMLFPEPAAQVSGRGLVLVFLLADVATGIKEDTIKVDVNGTNLEYTFGRDGQLVVRFTGTNRQLQNGSYTFKVTATDWMGNTSTSTFGLVIDNALPPIAPPPTTDTTGGGRTGGGPGTAGSGGGRGGGRGGGGTMGGG